MDGNEVIPETIRESDAVIEDNDGGECSDIHLPVNVKIVFQDACWRIQDGAKKGSSFDAIDSCIFGDCF